ncbi:MAG: hypothetical protein IMZ64_04105 [Bacteroidetes bacterium]|nr:hypothetical protein [Bacteroidota bacterium]
MPFQQVNLDQSIYKKGQAAYSQALKPKGGGIPLIGSFNAPNSSLERMKAEWAADDKSKKEERDMQMQKLQEVGMQTVQQQQQQKQQQVAQRQQIESDPEPAAKEMYELMKTLPDEAKQQLLQQIFTPTSTGGSISSGGKEVKMGAKYNPIAGVFLEKGWAMFDPKGNVNLSEPEPVTEKGTYTQNANGDVLNTATGEVVLNKGDIPEGINPTQILDVIKEARAYTTGLVDPSMIEGLTPEGRSTFFDRADKKFKEHVSWILQNTYNMTLEQATKIANNMPKEDTIGAPTGGEKGDTTMAYNIYDSIKGKEVSQEEKNYYITTYGQETWDIVERKLKETNKSKPTSESITKEFKALNYPTSPAKK